MKMETASNTQTDARMPGVAGILAGIVMIALAVLVVALDVPLPGGTMYGSQGQSVILLAFIGLCAMSVGFMEFQDKDQA